MDVDTDKNIMNIEYYDSDMRDLHKRRLRRAARQEAKSRRLVKIITIIIIIDVILIIIIIKYHIIKNHHNQVKKLLERRRQPTPLYDLGRCHMCFIYHLRHNPSFNIHHPFFE